MIDHPRYAAGEVEGEGAQGRVVRVVDRERPEARLVAKVLARGAAGSEARLAGEFALLARLRIPGLVRVHDFARDARGTPFFVEDLVVGDAPRAFVAADAARLASLTADLAETLAALHEAGFVHGDVKPDNVRVPAAGRAMLLDLGAAVAARGTGGSSVLTKAFAAPEVRAGASPSPASDVYSLAATLWACATGAPPANHARRGELRDAAPWVPPSLADAITRALAEHPSDRQRSPLDLLAGASRVREAIRWESASRGAHVREDAVHAVLAAPAGVAYVVAPSGAGKSHVVREAITRALLHGRDARLVRFPEPDPAHVVRLLAFLRGDERADPFSTPKVASRLVVFDDLHAAPIEVAEALDAFRCRAAMGDLTIVATAREAPPGAEIIELPPLGRAAVDRLCDELDVPRADRERIARAAGGQPGWIVASLGRVPLGGDAVLARVASLAREAREAVAIVATMGGDVPGDVLGAAEVAPAFEAGLLERDRDRVRLSAPSLAGDLAAALADFTVADRATEIALARDDIQASSTVAIARGPCAPAKRTALLAVAAERARREGARALEIEALLALVADPSARSPVRLERLERLTRDAGLARAHPQVLAWLDEAAPLEVLALRRRAEARAREGDLALARELADRAIAAATPEQRAYALATRGAIALWSADWTTADELFERARAALTQETADEDDEEIARLDHNRGVVALYRGRPTEASAAFLNAIRIKRALGDRSGVRACLLNLGLARTRERKFDDAESALEEALALATSLGQEAGRGWSLAARAELEVRRGRGREAERLVAEAEAIGDAVPRAVRADLALLRAEIALLEGDGARALASIAAVETDLRAEDALVDARALVLEARAQLVALPVDRRAAARTAIRALRRARTAELPEPVAEAEAVLLAARRPRGRRGEASASPADEERAMPNDELWDLLTSLGDAEPAACGHRLAQLVVAEARAERAIVATVDEGANVASAWGADIDGLAIAEADKRIDAGWIATARRHGAPVYQPDVSTAGGRGSRLVACGKRAAIIVEHRFIAGAFDHVTAARAIRWAVLADVVARLALPGAEPRARAARSSDAASSTLTSTSVPRREVTRDYPEIIGRSPVLRRALAQLDAAVDTDLPVLVRGETGTGKELFAQALHEHGARRSGPFVAVNCAAIADALFEAELFGHARGAFTGAERARGGLLARAEGGTILLDEIGELPLARQATLLRVLESKRYRPVGSDEERAFDVRIVAATNRDLDAAVAEPSATGQPTFRNDLLYRLRVLEVVAPPLRERRGDVEILLRHFLTRVGSRAAIAPAAMDALDAYAFPGNVRELLHFAQRLGAAGLTRIDVAHLPRAVRQGLAGSSVRTRGGASGPDAERAEVENALAATAGNISRAAGILGLTRHGLKKRMLRLGLRAKEAAG